MRKRREASTATASALASQQALFHCPGLFCTPQISTAAALTLKHRRGSGRMPSTLGEHQVSSLMSPPPQRKKDGWFDGPVLYLET